MGHFSTFGHFSVLFLHGYAETAKNCERELLNLLKSPCNLEMRLLINRFEGWMDVMREEFGVLTWGKRWLLVVEILRTLFLGRFVGRKEFFRKMRGCGGCIVYDRTLKRCRPWTGHHAGCGCYMPFKVMMGGKCWGDENGVSDEDIGWGDVD